MDLNKSTLRFDGLEALRGLAAIAIIVFHSILLTDIKDIIVATWYNNLGIAVPIFFCISGFSLFHGYHNNFFNEDSFKKFYIRRFFRIAPLFYFMLIFYITFFYFRGVKFELETILSNITFSFILIAGKQESIVWSGWSIGIEWLFYIIFPLLLLISKNKFIFLLLLFISLYLSIESSALYNIVNYEKSPSYLYMNIFKHGIYFMLGISICKIINIKDDKFYMLKKISQADVFILIALYIGILYSTDETIIKYTSFVMVFLAVFLAIFGGSIILNNKITRFWGMCSYGLYLFNPFVIYILNSIGFYEYISNSMVAYPVVGTSIKIIVIIGVTTLGAWLSHNYFEQPFINLGKRIIQAGKEKA